MFSLIKELWNFFPKDIKIKYYYLIILIMISSIFEVISIGAIFPLLEILTNFNKNFKFEFLNKIIKNLNIDETNLKLYVILLFIFLSLFSGLIRIILLRVSTRLSFNSGALIALDIYKKTIYQPYLVHVSRNSSEVVSGIILKSKQMISAIIMPMVNALSSLFIFISITLFLIQLDPLILGSFFSIFGLLYFTISFYYKKKLSYISKVSAMEQNNNLKVLTEGLGAIRDVIIDSTQNIQIELFKKSDSKLREVNSDLNIIAKIPKFIIETIAMVSVAFILLYLTGKEEGLIGTVPLIASVALGAQRILPTMQIAYHSWVTVKSNKNNLEDILKLLNQEIPDQFDEKNNLEKITFINNIVINDISFRYNKDSKEVLSDINLEIKKGEKVGFIGITGSGKSTLLDIIMGLLNPQAGDIIIDGINLYPNKVIAWQKLISHVPQYIFLTDSSILENIAIGIPREEIDLNRVIQAAKMAQILEHIETLPEKFSTIVGERGVKLSGGQRQRIGIARAFYKQASVLILDEATSALDNETENNVMESINNLNNNPTVLMIAHRLTTLKNCDKIIELKQGRVEKIHLKKDFQKILKQN